MLVGKEQTIDNLKFGNYFKEIFMDSDTKVVHSGAPITRRSCAPN